MSQYRNMHVCSEQYQPEGSWALLFMLNKSRQSARLLLLFHLHWHLITKECQPHGRHRLVYRSLIYDRSRGALASPLGPTHYNTRAGATPTGNIASRSPAALNPCSPLVTETCNP